MTQLPYRSALIIDTGLGITSSLTQLLSLAGLQVAVAAGDVRKFDRLAEETGAIAFRANATRPDSASELFEAAEKRIGVPEVVIYNAVRYEVDVSAFAGFLIVQEATKRLLPLGKGAILLAGAALDVKAFAHLSPSALDKFGLRGLAQSMARELTPKGIHVVHLAVDGPRHLPTRAAPSANSDRTLDPEAIARTYLTVLCQPRSAWNWEMELRPRAKQKCFAEPYGGRGRTATGRFRAVPTGQWRESAR